VLTVTSSRLHFLPLLLQLPANPALDFLRDSNNNSLAYKLQLPIDDDKNGETNSEASRSALAAVLGLHQERLRPSVVNIAIGEDTLCGRDHKWRLVASAIERTDCDCIRLVRTLASSSVCSMFVVTV
jgi:hypothetical protein